MLRVLKLIVMAMMVWLIWGMTQQQSLGLWMLGFVAAIACVIGTGFYKMYQNAR